MSEHGLPFGGVVLPVTEEPAPPIYYPGTPAPIPFGQQVADHWSGNRLPIGSTAYSQGVTGMYCCGSPYACAIQKDLNLSRGLGGGEWTLIVTFSLHSLPVMLADPDEVHVIFNAHEPISSGVERVSIGITPSGRIVGRVATWPDTATPIGTITPDNVIHQVALQLPSSPDGGLALSLDGVVIVRRDGGPLLLQEGFFPRTGSLIRFMAFNGIDGLSRVECSIHQIEIHTENVPVGWLFNEAHGLIVNDYEWPSTGWVDRGEMPAQPADGSSDYTGSFDLTADWYNPLEMGRPLLWGPIPTTPIQGCMRWSRGTGYSGNRPDGTGYASSPAGGPGYSGIQPSGPTIYSRDRPPPIGVTRST